MQYPQKRQNALLFLLFFLLFKTGFTQNVGISSTSSFIPDASAGLDVSYTDKGLLIPRVALTATNAAGPITSPATSLLVYNTATAGTSPNNVTPAYYYWNGSTWVMLAAQGVSSGWSTTGNASTSYKTNFLGTTDNNSLRIRTFNTQRMVVDSLGNVGIGSTNFTPSYPEKLLIDAGITNSNNLVTATGSIDGYLQFNLQNLSNGGKASSDVVATANNGTNTSSYIDMGVNSAGYTASTNNLLAGSNTAYLYANASDFFIGNAGLNKNLIFFTNQTSTSGITANGTERMRITPTGQVGINTSSPSTSYQLTVAGGISATSYFTSSDRRLKTNIKTLPYGLREILALKPVIYNWKTTPNKNKQLGLIAQDVRKILPEVVAGNEKKEKLAVNYSELVPVLINAIKEQQKGIEKQQKEIESLKHIVDKLQKVN